MKLNWYFGIVGVIGLVMGGAMLLLPATMVAGFALQPGAEMDGVLRSLGATIVGLSTVNFMALRNPAPALQSAALWMNAAVHGLVTLADLWSVSTGAFQFGVLAPELVAHIVIVAVAIYFIRGMGSGMHKPA